MRCLALLCVLLVFVATAHPQYAPAGPASEGVLGYWSTDAGSVLQIHPCGPAVCITILTISQKAPGVVDAHKPDPALRTRPVCKMDIGSAFVLTDPDHAKNGRIYDPESGKTYSSVLASEGDTLHLRGYIGIKAFGRSETWHRTSAAYATCVGISHR